MSFIDMVRSRSRETSVLSVYRISELSRVRLQSVNGLNLSNFRKIGAGNPLHIVYILITQNPLPFSLIPFLRRRSKTFHASSHFEPTSEFFNVGNLT